MDMASEKSPQEIGTVQVKIATWDRGTVCPHVYNETPTANPLFFGNKKLIPYTPWALYFYTQSHAVGQW